MKLNKKIIALIEDKTNVGVSDDGKYYTLYVDNACGEDFSFIVVKGENEIEDIISYCDGYDADEHFKDWFGANNGEPSDARTLLDNCEEIGENLKELSVLLYYLDY